MRLDVRVVLLEEGRALGTFGAENMSASGLLLRGEAPVAIGAALEVLLTLPSGREIRLGAEVARADRASAEATFAVRFSGVQPDDEDAIHSTVLRALEDATDASVLVVDDSPEICRALKRDLSRLGRSSYTVTTPLEAMRFLENSDDVSAAIVDLVLGKADGADVLAFLAAERPEVRRILMSGVVRVSQLELARASGSAPAHAVLAKPWTDESLRQAIGDGVDSGNTPTTPMPIT